MVRIEINEVHISGFYSFTHPIAIGSKLTHSLIDFGVPFGPGYLLIRLQALHTWPVSAFIPNAGSVICHLDEGEIL